MILVNKLIVTDRKILFWSKKDWMIMFKFTLKGFSETLWIIRGVKPLNKTEIKTKMKIL